ncbi:MAG: type II secretion system F family protein [Nitrososphaerota archaeon]
MTPLFFLFPGLIATLLAFLIRGYPDLDLFIASSAAVASALPLLVSAGLGQEAPYRFASSSLGAPVFQRVLPWASRLLKGAMVFRESEEFAARVAISLVGGALSAAGALTVAMIAGVPLAAAGAALALVPFLEVLSVNSRASARREWTEAELPFFTTLAVALISAGMSFYYVLRRASELPHVFRQVRKEALLIIRNVEVVGMGVLEAMEEAARDHPSPLFRSLVFTITGVSRTGGSVRAAVIDRGREALVSMRQKWEAFANRMRSLGEISVIVFMLLPLSLSVAGIAFASVAYQGLLVMNLLGLPVLGLMFTVLVIGSVPKVYDVYTPPRALLPMALLAGIGAGLVGYLAASAAGSRALPIAFASGAAAASAVVWLAMRGQVREVFSSNAQVPRLLREIVEARKSGLEFHEAVREAALSGRYTGPFGQVLKRVAARMMMFSASESAKDMRSWSARMAFLMLDEIESSGGGSPVLLEGTIETLSAYDMNRRNGAAAARLHMFMAFLFPAIALIATSMILVMAGQLSSLAEAQQQVRFATPSELERVVEMAWLSVAEASVMLAIAISRAMDLSFYNLWRVTVVSVFLIVAMVIQPAVMYQLAGFLMPQAQVG